MNSKLNNDKALEFMLAGKAFVTLRSEKTGMRYTYRVSRAKDKALWFVALLTGPENNTNYSYMGVIQNDQFRLTAKSRYLPDSVPVRAFRYVYERFVKGMEPKDVEIWHEGKCGRCGRLLTVPESIERGIGPECAGIMGEDFNRRWAEHKNEFARREAEQEQQAFLEGMN